MHLKNRPRSKFLRNTAVQNGVQSKAAQDFLNHPPFPGDAVPLDSPDDWTFPENDVFGSGQPHKFRWGFQDSATQNEGGGTIDTNGTHHGDPIDNNFVEAVRKDPSRVADRSVPLPGNDDWRRTADKVTDLKRLGANAYGLTVDWGRIFPVDGGPPDLAATQKYLDIIKQSFDAGIEPVVTFIQYAFPKYYTSRGGMLADDFVSGYGKFVRFFMAELGKLAEQDPKYAVTLYNTINEPNAMAGMAYAQGQWPPFEQNPIKFVQAMITTLKLHAAGYLAIHEVGEKYGIKTQVAIAHNMRPFHPYRTWNPLDQVVAKVPDYVINHWFLDSVQAGKPKWIPFASSIPGLKGSFDWVGLNYYVRDVMKFKVGGSRYGMAEIVRNPDLPLTTYPDDNTYDPDGMYECLMDLWAQFHKPMMITEWGVDDTSKRDANGLLVDQLRPRHFIDTFSVLWHFANAVPGALFGALNWTQYKNWEWTQGYNQDSGAIDFDPKTGVREDKFSVTPFQRLARHGLHKSWRTPWNEQSPVSRDKYAKAAADNAGIGVPGAP